MDSKQRTEMKSILKRRDRRSSSNRCRSDVMQPYTTSGSVVEINAEDVCLSTVPWSADRWPPSSPAVPHDIDVVRRPRVSHVADEVERKVDADLQRVEEKLTRMECQLNSQFQQFERRLRLPAVKDPQVGLTYR